MSRFIHPLPFSPLYEFQVCRVVTINGVEYKPGDRMDTEARDALGERRLRQLYERRTITPIAPAALPALVQAGPVDGVEAQMDGEPGQGEQVDGATADGEQLDPVAEQGGDAPAEHPASGLTAVHKGFGRWYVVAADGTEDGPMTKEQAEAKVAA